MSVCVRLIVVSGLDGASSDLISRCNDGTALSESIALYNGSIAQHDSALRPTSTSR